jgi:homoserine kinase type II
MEHMARQGIACPLPLRTGDGNQLVSLNGRRAAILTFLNGLSLRRPQVAHCASAGAMLAALHRAGESFTMQRPNALGHSGWRALAKTIGNADAVEDGLTALIGESLAHLEAEWPRDLPGGVIHADLFPDNVLFMQDAVSGVIDFYFACNDYYAYDLAIMLNSWCFETDGSYNVTKGRALIHAYQAHRPLSAAEAQALPLLMRGATLRFLLTRTFDWINRDGNGLVRPKDPREYSRRLRFHRQVRHAEEYGL